MAATKTCYIFAIGGTGARILESLTYLLASGSNWYGLNERNPKAQNQPHDNLRDWQFVPIILDLDKSNGNLDRCTTLLEKYRVIHNYTSDNDVSGLEHSFFRFPILTLKEKSNSNDLTENSFVVSGHLKTTNTLGQLIDYSKLDDTAPGTKKLVDLLYSKSDKALTLEKGFKGNPHIGSIFFEQFQDEKLDLIKILREQCNFNAENDRIFIISSIFGGTGAAGFPWLVKTLRTQDSESSLKNARIGALSVLPYFTLHGGQANSSIDSNSFVTKTKAALKYYGKNIDKHLNSIYYVGDNETPFQVPNYEGGKEQKNPQTPIDLIGASSIIDFLQTPDENINNFNDGLPTNPIEYAYGIQSDTEKNVIYWGDLRLDSKQEKTRKNIFIPFLYFHIANLMVRKIMPEARTITWAIDTGIIKKEGSLLNTKFNREFFNSEFYGSLTFFMKKFTSWLDEQAGKESAGHLKFKPFEIDPAVTPPAFTELINPLVKNYNLTDGQDVLAMVRKEGNTTTYYYEKNRIYYKDLLNYVNKRSIVSKAKAIQHQDVNKELAMRLMYFIYAAPFELIKEQATSTFVQ